MERNAFTRIFTKEHKSLKHNDLNEKRKREKDGERGRKNNDCGKFGRGKQKKKERLFEG